MPREFYSARCGLSRSPGTSSRGRCRPPSIAPVGRNENLTNPDTCGIRNAPSRLCPAGSIRRAFSFARAAPAWGATSPARPGLAVRASHPLAQTGGEGSCAPCPSNSEGTDMLTPRQQRFVEEYLVDPNGHQAALRAGYAPRGARQTVTHLLKRPEVAQAIRRGMDARAERMRLDADRVLAELVRIAFADIGNLVDWGPDGVTLKPKRELSADDRAAVAEVAAGAGKGGAGPRIRLHSKPRALDAIARHFGLYG